MKRTSSSAPELAARAPALAARAAQSSPIELERRAREEMLAELRALYAELDAHLAGFTCDASADCCHFGRTGREPYPSAIEIAELERAVRARGGPPKQRQDHAQRRRDDREQGRRQRSLPVADERRCALLSAEATCAVYAARPLGCRTFFCERGRGAAGEEPPPPRGGETGRIARAIAELSARFAPADPGPRPLSKVTADWDAKRR
jgi:Fe-S-cluster containining protein